jgi:actin-like ATPase involved in cell morphogenesis
MLRKLRILVDRLFKKKTATKLAHSESATASPPPQAPRAKNRLSQQTSPRPLLINIGVDFGTSSTKVVVRNVLEDRAVAFTHANAVDGYGAFCWPSTVRVNDGRLYFGNQAEAMQYGQAIRSFKVCVACHEGAFTDKQLEERGCKIGVCQHSQEKGTFGLGSSDKRVVFRADELTALYLAELLATVRCEVDAQLSPQGNAKYTVNMAAPLDLVTQPPLKTAFDRAVFAGWELVGKVKQGMTLAEARDVLDSDNVWPATLPGEDLRSTFVIPETHAAMIGYVISGKAMPGLYAIVDVGAGTTDVAVFRFCDKHAVRDVAYYSAQTDLVGCDDLDRQLAACVAAQDGDLLATVRKAKHAIDRKGLRVGHQQVPLVQVVEAVEPVLKRMYGCYRATWGKAWMKEMRYPVWRELVVLVHGGGNQWDVVKERFRTNPSRDCGGMIKHIKVIPVELPPQMGMLGRARSPELGGYDSLLIVAHGLSFHRAQHPQYFAPHEIGVSAPRSVFSRSLDYIDEDPG